VTSGEAIIRVGQGSPRRGRRAVRQASCGLATALAGTNGWQKLFQYL